MTSAGNVPLPPTRIGNHGSANQPPVWANGPSADGCTSIFLAVASAALERPVRSMTGTSTKRSSRQSTTVVMIAGSHFAPRDGNGAGGDVAGVRSLVGAAGLGWETEMIGAGGL